MRIKGSFFIVCLLTVIIAMGALSVSLAYGASEDSSMSSMHSGGSGMGMGSGTDMGSGMGMGSGMDQMMKMAEQMMGSKNYGRMQELMNKMMSGTMTSQDMQEMTKMMQDPRSGAMASSVMMQGMMAGMHGSNGQGMMGGQGDCKNGQGMMNGHGSWSNGSGMMNGSGTMGTFRGHSFTSITIFCWITAILLWILMITTIVYLFQLISKRPQAERPAE